MKVEFYGGYIEYEPIIKDRSYETFDPLPSPSKFHVPSYHYLSYIWVNEKLRGKGIAKQVLTQFLQQTRRSLSILLYNGNGHNGFVMKRMLKRMGFKVIRWSDFPNEFCYMFLKRP